MLGKLLKYELKATAHYFLPLFAATLLFPIILRLYGSVFGHGSPWISGLLLFVEVLLIVTLAVMVLVITIQRFYKNLLGNEGYLMFTLPVSAHHNILSKLLTATLWNCATMLVVALSILIMASSADIGEALRSGWQFFSNALRTENLDPLLLILEWALVGLIGVASNILVLYLAMAIGQLANEHKFLVSFGAFVGIQTAGGMATAFFGGVISSLPISWLKAISTWLGTLSIATVTHLLALVIVIIALVIGAIYYFVTYWLLKHKLNLT